MFFIIGNPRSGTSLFRLLLTSHSNVHIPPECGFMLWWEKKYTDWTWAKNEQDLGEFLDDLFSSKKFEFWDLDRTDVAKTINENQPDNFSSLCYLIYKVHLDKFGGDARLIGDKNNFHLHHINELHQLFPKAKFIHIIRDGRDVATSYIDMSKIESSSDYRPRLPSDIADIANEWKGNIEAVRNGFSALPSDLKLEIRYEDLVLNTEDTLTWVCSHLGLDFESSMLKFYEKNQSKKLEPDEFMAWKSRTKGKIDSSAIGKWKTLSQFDVSTFEKHTKEILSLYNYDLSEQK